MITKAKIRDLEQLDNIARLIVHNMNQSNIPQWYFPYPRYKVFMKDYMANGLYVDRNNVMIHGSITLLKENDPAYQTISSWRGSNALVIHRLMVHPMIHHKGFASNLISFAIALAKKEGYDSIKTDTHFENYKMRSLLEKHGFQALDYLPTIDRLAYEIVWEENNE